MDHVEARDARGLPGLRLAVTYKIPNPFCEAAKAIFHVKGLAFTPVAQHSAQPNEDLLAWTGHRNAPVAVWNDEPARAGWAEILMLAERLAPQPSLLPADRFERALVFGLSNEICGEDGFAWNSRLLMFPEQAAGEKRNEEDTWTDLLTKRYGGSAGAVGQARDKAGAVLRMLAARLHAQKEAGSRYFVGRGLTAVDLYWATLSIGVAQLPEAMCDTPRFLRKVWGRMGEQLAADLDPILIEHRDFIWSTYLPPTLDF
jgi:glutathione S-transferase